ncbi:MAG: hypothetical protein ACYC35_03270 [Pirellulales bacterium]|jgi:hypothetical protein
MPNRRFDWHEHIKDIEGEYRAARIAVDRLKAQVVAAPDLLKDDDRTRAYLRDADRNLEGTYLVRLFAAFEAALRSYDRAWHNDPNRTESASVLIDSIGGRRGQGISTAVREGAQAVRLLRNYWAHENEAMPVAMTLAEARARVQKYLSLLPNDWD